MAALATAAYSRAASASMFAIGMNQSAIDKEKEKETKKKYEGQANKPLG